MMFRDFNFIIIDRYSKYEIPKQRTLPDKSVGPTTPFFLDASIHDGYNYVERLTG